MSHQTKDVVVPTEEQTDTTNLVQEGDNIRTENLISSRSDIMSVTLQETMRVLEY